MTQITVKGLIATTPQIIITDGNVVIASFRLASGERRFDRELNEWVSDATNWFTVSLKGRNAMRFQSAVVMGQVDKGSRVIVVGDLRIRDWDNGERSGTAVEIDANSIGLDLASDIFEVTQTTEQATEETADAHRCNCNNCNR